MTERAGGQTGFGRRLGVVAVLGLVGTGVGPLMQLLVPAVLLRVWSESEYALVVAIQGICVYVTVADAGILATLLHRLSILEAAGEHAEAKRVAAGGLRALLTLSTIGLLAVIGVALGSGKLISSHLSGVSSSRPTIIALTLTVQALAYATGVSLAGFSTAVEYARGEYVRAQLFGVLRAVTAIGTLVAFAALHQPATRAIMAGATAAIAVDIARFARNAAFLRGRTAAPPSIQEFLWSARGGPVYALALASSNGLIPSVLSIMSPSAAAAAIPGRTAANGARLVSLAIGNSIWAPLAARMEALRDDPTARTALFRRVATVLASLQCGAVCGIILVAGHLIPIWVPSKAALILGSLPLFLIEQAVWVAIVPSQNVLMSAGRFGAIGFLSLAASTVTLAVTILLLPTYGGAALGAGLASAGLFVLLPGFLWLEREHWKADGAKPPSLTPQLVLGALALTAVSLMKIWPLGGQIVALVACALSGYRLLDGIRHLRRPAAQEAEGNA